ncbi:MAG: signal peptidase I [Bacilli bacterium]|nr:signal peptidase I [Bacilli bacterium]
MENNGKVKKNILKNKAIALLVKILVIIAIFVITFSFIFGLKRITSINMYPNLKAGDLILYYRLERMYNVGEVVLVKHDDKVSIMRIIAKSNEVVDIKDGKITVNNIVEEKEAFYKTKKNKKASIEYPYTVEEGKYFVAYDYRSNKNDSRTFGTIDQSAIKGRVIGKLQIRNI